MSLPMEIGTEKFRLIMGEMLSLLDEEEMVEFTRLNIEEGHNAKQALKMLEDAHVADN